MATLRNNDPAHELTEDIIARIERRLASIYKEAADELKKEVDAYFEQFEKQDAAKRKQLDDGKISELEYKSWRKEKMAVGDRYKALQNKLAERFTNANEVAISYINGTMPEVYAINHNYAAYTIEKFAGNLDFTLFDEDTVKRLILEDPDLLPNYPNDLAVKRGIDLAYGREQITRTITSSILQGKSIQEIAKDLMDRIQGMNQSSAVRAARTAATSAENAGRMDSYKRASEMGIKVRKRWIATKDTRTRDAHGKLDGQVKDWDKPFDSILGPIMYPGDRSANPANVYNCRCSIRTVEKEGIEAEPRMMRVRDPVTGKNVLVNEMTYEEWEKWKRG